MTDRCLGSLLEAERAAELVQQGLAYSYLPSLEAVLSSELRFLALRYHSLTSRLRVATARQAILFSLPQGETDQPSPSYGSASA